MKSRNMIKKYHFADLMEPVQSNNHHYNFRFNRTCSIQSNNYYSIILNIMFYKIEHVRY